MLLTIGNYSCGINQTTIDVRVRLNWSNVGQPYSRTIMIRVQGYLLTTVTNGSVTAQQADLVAQEQALVAALSVPYPNIYFYQDSGAVAESLTNVNSMTGVKIIDGPHFADTHGPEYCAIRTFDFTAESEYPLPNSANFALSFTETLDFHGGLPLYIHKLAINGPPQKQETYPATPYCCTQSGVIVGYQGYLSAPAPKFPNALMRAPTNRVKSPERRGGGGGQRYQGFERYYEYYFESVSPLNATPTLWVA